MLLVCRTILIPLCIVSALCLASPAPEAQTQPAASPSVAVPAAQALASRPLEEQGDLLMARGSFAAALDAFQQVQPRSAVIWNKIGIAYHHLFALDQALNGYRNALALNPHYAEAWNNLGAAYYGKHDFAAAEKAYKRALKYQARAAGTYSNLATLYFAEAKYKKGVKAYQRAFEIDPEAFTREKRQPIEEPATREQRMATAFYLAEVYASAGHNEAALASLRKAFSEGFSDRKRLMGDRQLASLRDTPEFHQLMAEQHFDELH